MSMTEEIVLQAKLMSAGIREEEHPLLEAACRAAEMSLSGNLRSGITIQDCRSDYVMAAAMMALATMSEIGVNADIEQFTAGELTLRRGGSNAAAGCLRLQAQVLMGPYLRPGVAFLGV